MPLISRKQVMSRTSLSQPTLWRKEQAGEFPKAVRISASRVAYDSEAVDAWIRLMLSTGDADREADTKDQS